MNNEDQVKKGANEEIGKTIAGAIIGKIDATPMRVIWGQDPEPLELHEETPINLIGILDTPARWLEARHTLVEDLAAYVMIDREEMSIKLVTEERNHFKNVLVGTLEFHPAFIKFGINSEKYITPAQMADKIKMNRAFFENKQVAMNLVTQLKDFTATVSREIEKKSDTKGNYKDLRQQTVLSNLPESFKMKLPIFKGEKSQVIEVEVYIEAENLGCTLISPEANEETERLRDTAIDDVIARIIRSVPGIVVLEK